MKRSEHNALAVWAVDCAERVLYFFERERPKDRRPREAIETCREWVRTWKVSMRGVRGIALSAHVADRETAEHSSARFAARSAGHALATVNVPTHSIAAASYAAKATSACDPKGAARNVAKERDWQYRRLVESSGSKGRRITR